MVPKVKFFIDQNLDLLCVLGLSLELVLFLALVLVFSSTKQVFYFWKINVYFSIFMRNSSVHNKTSDQDKEILMQKNGIELKKVTATTLNTLQLVYAFVFCDLE